MKTHEYSEIIQYEDAIKEIINSKPMVKPDKTEVEAGHKYWIWAKIGGEMQFVRVVCKCKPYIKNLKNGGTAWYVDVFTYGLSKAVNITKLRLLQ